MDHNFFSSKAALNEKEDKHYYNWIIFLDTVSFSLQYTYRGPNSYFQFCLLFH